LFNTQFIKHEGKDGQMVEAAPQGAEAVIPLESQEKQPLTAVQVDKTKLYCSCAPAH
jgi:E3 ubiquitin-protein ligase SIAH1